MLALALALPSAGGAWPGGSGWAGRSIAGTLSSRAVSAGTYHSCGVRTDATLACWGRNIEGQATPPAGSFTAVSAGYDYSCGVRTDATLACWGKNDVGQATPPAGSFTAVSAGEAHSCGVRTDATLACWGSNSNGRATPPAGSFTAVSAGYTHSCALRTDGTLACWGRNAEGQATPPAGSFTAVSAGYAHSCGVRTDATLACWGSDVYGQSTAPAGGFTAVSGGAFHSCGVRVDGTLACWGDIRFGQATPPAGSFAAVSAGGQHSCGVRIEGTLACWGTNPYGQLGAAPAAPGPAPASTVFAGRSYSHTFVSSTGIPAGGFAVTAGSLPEGLNLSAAGLLSGTPTSGGSFAFTVTASNGLFADASASFSLTVIDDHTPPAITATVSGTAGQDGWYRSDVTVAWTVTEPESDSTLTTSGCEPTTVTSDTAGTTRTCTAASAGGSASQSLTIKRDTTAPTVSIQAPTATIYAHAQAVAAGYGCADTGSGIGACTAPVAPGAPIDTAGGGAKSFTVTASDHAGNTSSRTVVYTVAAPPLPPPPPPPPPQPAPAPAPDRTAPLISIAGVRGGGGRCTAHDFRVLVAIREPSQLQYARLLLDRRRQLSTRKKRFAVPIRAAQLHSGRHLITVTAQDIAGNSQTRSVHFTRCSGHAQR